MNFNDSVVYFVPPTETGWLFSLENLHTLSKVCSSNKRPRITSHKTRRVNHGNDRVARDTGQNSHHVSFHRKDLDCV